MLSEDLNHLAAEFDQYAGTGAKITTINAQALAMRLRAMSDQAKALEAMQVPEAARLDQRDLEGGRVARLADYSGQPPHPRCVSGDGS